MENVEMTGNKTKPGNKAFGYYDFFARIFRSFQQKALSFITKQINKDRIAPEKWHNFESVNFWESGSFDVR